MTIKYSYTHTHTYSTQYRLKQKVIAEKGEPKEKRISLYNLLRKCTFCLEHFLEHKYSFLAFVCEMFSTNRDQTCRSHSFRFKRLSS